MFKSIVSTTRSNLISPFNPGNIVQNYSYIITDDDFVEPWSGLCDQWLSRSEVRSGAVINCYSSKNQDVAYNLYLYHLFLKDKYYWYEIENEIQFNIDHVPAYVEYAPQVKKYLNSHNSMKVFL